MIGIEADAQYVDFGAEPEPLLLPPRPMVAASLPSFPAPWSTTRRASPASTTSAPCAVASATPSTGPCSTPPAVSPTAGAVVVSSASGVSSNDFRTGWAAGVGVEYALPTDSFLNFFRSSAVTLKVEGLYVNLDQGGRNNGAFATTANGTIVVAPRRA